MKKIGLLFVSSMMMFACGGSSGGGAKEPAPKTAQAEPASALSPEESVTPVEPEPAEELPPAPDTSYASPTPVEETAPAEVTPPATTMASAELLDVKTGEKMGTLTFEQGEGGQITISGEFTGLKKNSVHALYIHENGDCSSKGKKVGGHLNPTKQKHGPPSSGSRHAGDFGDIKADDTGTATFSMMTDSVTMDDIGRADTIVNRSVVIHAKKDDKKGSGGAVLACGVITVAQ